jgi:acetyl-CoA hydrolase/succinyl-CoA:acetate CoA-transferase
MHPDYKEQMQDYVEEALKVGGQTPHVMEKAFGWHLDLKTKGTMKKLVEVHLL